MRIATDTGGTFTDCVFVQHGKLQILKVPSQPAEPAAALANALEDACARLATRPREVDLVCGTTVGTNALLERRGGRVVLITTSGFEDLLEIGRQARPKLYDLLFEKPDVLVPAERRIGARERITAEGKVLKPLRSPEIRSLVGRVRRARPDAAAICFLFSFRNAAHEAALARALRRAGYLVSVSHEILPEFREFERTSTTVINAYLSPVMTAYLSDAQTRAFRVWGAQGFPAKRFMRVRVMQSNGGIISAGRAAAEPVRTVLSGPAGGVLGAAQAAALAGLRKVLTFDMGGTSTDVSLLSGETRITNEARVAGLPVAVPMMDIHTVGAGGGSIARFDQGGALRVGPESAGANPGPICYGRGELPTVTDAHAVLGHLGAGGLLNGAFPLDIRRAVRGFEKCKGSFRTVEEFAQAVIGVSNSVMERALRLISIERGHDPRDYTLVAFGGAGGLHACQLAEALELRGVLLPVFPGALSAIGILRADVVRDFSQTVLHAVDHPERARREVGRTLRKLRKIAGSFLKREGFEAGQQRFEHRFDLRYAGQAYDLSVPAEGDYLAAFHRAHERAYGHADTERPVEIVSVRCRATGISARADFPKLARARRVIAAKPSDVRKSYLAGKAERVAVFERERLCASERFAGPAIVTEYSATSLVPAGWRARVDAYGQIHLELAGRKARRYVR